MAKPKGYRGSLELHRLESNFRKTLTKTIRILSPFRSCKEHTMCGFVENQEYSTRDIGRSVLKTNHALRNKTFFAVAFWKTATR